MLRDVLDYSTTEVAELLDTSELAVKGALQRARVALAQHCGTAADPPPPPASAREREVTRRFAGLGLGLGDSDQ